MTCPKCDDPRIDTSEVDDFSDYCKPCRKLINLERWGYMNDSPIDPPKEGLWLSPSELQVVMKGLVTMATPSRQSDAAKVIHAAIAATKTQKRSKAHEWLSSLPELEGKSGVLAWSEPPPQDITEFQAIEKQNAKVIAEAFGLLKDVTIKPTPAEFYAKLEGDATPMACSPEKFVTAGPNASTLPDIDPDPIRAICPVCKFDPPVFDGKLQFHYRLSRPEDPKGPTTESTPCEGSGTNV